MMKTHRIALILVAVLILLALAVPAIGEPQQDIIVIDAKATLMPPVSEAPPPVDVETRVIAAYANEILREDLEAMEVPPSIPQRVVAAYANEILREDLEPMPTVPPVPQRVVAAFANEILRFEPVYPCELIVDTTPPLISNITPVLRSGSTVTVTWTTDEFANSEVLYGEETGQQTEVVSDTMWVKEHEIGLPGLVCETTYYYRVRSTDRCGNTATSTEYRFETCAERYVYLPLVLRDSP